MLELSLGELDALVLKAYRGAGFSWGIAQEAGRAASWLAERNLPAANMFATLLKQIDGVAAGDLTPDIASGQWIATVPAACPVVAGAVLSDLGFEYFGINQSEIELGKVYSPAILLPFVASSAAAEKKSLRLIIDNQPVLISDTGEIDCSDQQQFVLASCAGVVIGKAQVRAFTREFCQRAACSEPDMAVLNSLAHRTYVPASAQSRAAGAGAGLTDND